MRGNYPEISSVWLPDGRGCKQPAPINYLFIVALLMAFLPLSGVTHAYFSVAGLRFYEGMFILFLAMSPFILFDRRYFRLILVITALVTALSLHSAVMGQSLFNTINSLRDVFWYCIGIVVGKAAYDWCSDDRLGSLYNYLFGTYCVYLLLAYTVAAPLFVGHIEDAHAGAQLDEEGWWMRVGFSSQILLMFLFAHLLCSAKEHGRRQQMFFYSVSMLIPVACGGSRSLLGVYFIIILWVMVRRISFTATIFFLTSITFLWLGPDDGRFSLDGVVAGWIGRNGPFLLAILDFNPFDWLFGKGFGQMFEIPWFENTIFDSMVRNVDGLYQTLIVKVGIVGTLIFIGWHILLMHQMSKAHAVLSRSLFIILGVELLLGLTNTYLFQLSAIFYGIPVGLALELIRRRRLHHCLRPSARVAHA